MRTAMVCLFMLIFAFLALCYALEFIHLPGL
jgi:hypothetical protein